MSRRSGFLLGPVVWALCIAPLPTLAQTRRFPSPTVVALGGPATPVDVVSRSPSTFATAVAGAGFEAGALHRWLLGPHHRDVWTTPVAVEVLDLEATAGGLTPFETGGGMQTRSLRFRGGDGREYAFRSVAKDPSALLDPILRGTLVEDLLMDGISAAHPYGALVAAPLLDAVGVLHADPRLAVLPADPRLGPFEAEFAGMLGLFEERPDENDGGSTAFAGADRVIGSERLTERMDEGPMDRVDARAYLRARLMDVFLGDFDRHRGQWRWALRDDGGPRRWLPVPRDRDQVFAHFDGLATRIASVYVPQLVTFEPDYPDPVRLHWNSRAIDRWFLAELDREVWEDVGSTVRAALTDGVIDAAVMHLPPGIGPAERLKLASTLKARRDGLREASNALYSVMSKQVDVRGTEADEVVTVEFEPGRATVTIEAPDQLSGPYFVRHFDASETEEVRIYLRGGDDAVVVRGHGDPGMDVRVIGGHGDDRYDVGKGVTRVHLYDQEGVQDVRDGDPGAVDTRVFDEWEWTPEDRDQPRDWGSRARPLFWASYGTDLGAFVGGGFRRERYGFRQPEFASAVEARAGFAPSLGKGRFEIAARKNRANSPLFGAVRARYSGVDVLHFYGTGNATAAGDDLHHRVDVSRASASIGVGAALASGLELSADVGIERTHTSDRPERFLATLGSVYGAGDFTTVEIGGHLAFDPLVDRDDIGHRLRVNLDASLHPSALDADGAFGRVRVGVSSLVAPTAWPAVSLAFRGGAEQVLGRVPWHRAAFLGGNESLRGWDDQRFAGDAAIHGGVELRLRVLSPRVVVPSALGVFGFADAGRVFVDGISRGGWHTGMGGGFFLHPARQPYMLKLGGAVSEEATKLFLTIGLPY